MKEQTKTLFYLAKNNNGHQRENTQRVTLLILQLSNEGSFYIQPVSEKKLLSRRLRQILKEFVPFNAM